jgi:hypothetical protein
VNFAGFLISFYFADVVDIIGTFTVFESIRKHNSFSGALSIN